MAAHGEAPGGPGPARSAAAPRGGHRGVPHTADLRIEAWAPTREECLAHVVRGVCEAFADLGGAVPVRRREVTLRADDDEDLLIALLDEIVYRLDTADEVPIGSRITPVPGGVRAVLDMADAAVLPVTGAAPKAVTLNELVFAEAPGGWTAAVTLDV